jgi:predicted nucleotidyltransferase
MVGARGSDRPTSDVDVMIIGAPDRRALSERVVGLEQDLGRDVNVTTYAHDEFEALRARGDTFIADVLAGPRIALVGVRGGS